MELLDVGHVAKYFIQRKEFMTSYEMLKQLVQEGYKERIRPFIAVEDKQKYIDRLKYEMATIHELGFDDYFLIVWDIIEQARKLGIPVGPGRGSVAGSLIAYGLNITQLDPIQYNLFFERFLNKERVAAPDIDIDFSSKKREIIIEYIKEKYGDDHVCQVVTYSEMKARGLLRDLAKVFGMDALSIDKMAKVIDDVKTVDEALQNDALKPYEAKYPEMFEVARQLNGCIAHVGKHAAGVIITKDTLLESLPVMMASDGEHVISQWDKDTLEHLNYLKMDILGLDTLDVIDETLDRIGHNAMEEMSLKDKHIYNEFSKGHSVGVFTFETYNMRNILKRLDAEKLEDLSAVNALGRPGAYEGLELYLKGKETGEVYYFDDDRLKSILEETYGTIAYQEQAIAIVQAVAGFSAGKADLLRRAIGKKKPEELQALHKTFVDGCIANGQKEKWAEKIFSIIAQGEAYSFNKSHSLVYAYIGYQAMFLKLYYPLEFMSRRMSNSMGHGWEKGNKLDTYEKECRRIGIKIIDWDINTSENDYTFSREENCIYRGLAAIKNVGKASYEIVAVRKAFGEPFRSFEDFYKRVNKSKVRSNAIKALIMAGAFDSIEDDRHKMSRWMDMPTTKAREATQKSLFGE